MGDDAGTLGDPPTGAGRTMATDRTDAHAAAHVQRRVRPVRAVVLAGIVAVAVGLSMAPATGSDETGDALAAAVAAGDVELVGSLLAAGADPDEPRVNGFTPLMRAAIRDDAPIVERLVTAGAEIEAADPAGLTAAHVAAQQDAAAALRALVDAGADPTMPSASGMGTVHHAALGGAVDSLRLLHELGIDLDERSSVISQGHGYPRDVGPTPLGIAVRAGQTEAVELLLALGADVDATSTSGHTPLLIAVFFDVDPDIVELLLEAGADRTVVAPCELGCAVDGGDALDWARELGRTELSALLEADASAPSPA